MLHPKQIATEVRQRFNVPITTEDAYRLVNIDPEFPSWIETLVSRDRAATIARMSDDERRAHTRKTLLAQYKRDKLRGGRHGRIVALDD